MLSSWQISKKTFSWLRENKLELLKVNLPLIFVFIVMLFAKLIKSDLYLLLNFFQMWFFTVSIIQIHRKILLDNQKYQMLLFPKPEKTHFVYLLAFAVLNFINTKIDPVMEMIVGNILTPNPTWIELIFGFIIIIFITCLLVYITVRFYFIFPYISINKKFDTLFVISKGFFWRIFNSTAIVYLPLIPIIYILNVIFILYFKDLFMFIYLLNFYLALTLINIHYSIISKELMMHNSNYTPKSE
jgi:hypothetical protein